MTLEEFINVVKHNRSAHVTFVIRELKGLSPMIVFKEGAFKTFVTRDNVNHVTNFTSADAVLEYLKDFATRKGDVFDHHNCVVRG